MIKIPDSIKTQIIEEPMNSHIKRTTKNNSEHEAYFNNNLDNKW